MKNDVLHFLSGLPEKKSAEHFNKAFELYRKSPGANARFSNLTNAQGFTPARLESLLHELSKLHKITAKEIKLYVRELDGPVAEVQAAQETIDPSLSHLKIGQVFKIDGDLKLMVTTKENLFPMAPDQVKTEIKLRDEFPFLKEADCPNEIKILVADKFNYYDAYVAAHNALLVLVPEEGQEPVAMSPADIFALAQTAVDNFIMNQEIYKELVHYKTTGKVLGKHPLLVDLKKIDIINAESPARLAVRDANLVNYINRAKKEIGASSDSEQILKLTGKIASWEKEQKLVKARLETNVQ